MGLLSLYNKEVKFYFKIHVNWYTIFPPKDAAATNYFNPTTMRRPLEGGAYSRAAFNSVAGTHVHLHTSVSSRRNDRLLRFFFVCSFMCTSRSTW